MKEAHEKYGTLKRIKIANRYNWWVKRQLLGILIPVIPSSWDIHVHIEWMRAKEISEKFKKQVAIIQNKKH